MGGAAVLGFLFFALPCWVFTVWLAREKGYDTPTWGLLGFLFTLPALIAIGFAPDRSRESGLGRAEILRAS
jgi:hypothetical protein